MQGSGDMRLTGVNTNTIHAWQVIFPFVQIGSSHVFHLLMINTLAINDISH